MDLLVIVALLWQKWWQRCCCRRGGNVRRSEMGSVRGRVLAVLDRGINCETNAPRLCEDKPKEFAKMEKKLIECANFSFLKGGWFPFRYIQMTELEIAVGRFASARFAILPLSQLCMSPEHSSACFWRINNLKREPLRLDDARKWRRTHDLRWVVVRGGIDAAARGGSKGCGRS